LYWEEKWFSVDAPGDMEVVLLLLLLLFLLFVRGGIAPVWVFFFHPPEEEEMVFPSTVRHGCQRCTRRDALRTADNNSSMPVVDTISVRDEVEQLGRSKSTASSCTCTMP
jgi:hypothetical protein